MSLLPNRRRTSRESLEQSRRDKKKRRAIRLFAERLEQRVLLTTVTSVDPPANSHSAPVSTDITAMFDQNIKLSPATAQNFVVHTPMKSRAVTANTARAAATGTQQATTTIIDDDELTGFAVTALTATSTGFQVAFTNDIDVADLSLYDTQTAGLGPADVVLIGAASGPVIGSLVVDASQRMVEFIKTEDALTPDTYTVTLRSATNGFEDTGGLLLDGNGDGTGGDDYSSAFTVDEPAAGTVTVSIPDIVRGPGQEVHLPADATTGIPLTISDGTNVRAIDVRISYDPTLLNITAATLGPDAPPGASVILNSSTPGLAIVVYFATAPLPAGAGAFVNLQATVPTENASENYRRQQVLDVHRVIVSDGNDNESPVIENDALQVASFFADVSANGRINAADAAQVARIAALLDGGFSNTPSTDPRLVGDISGNGRLNAADASLVAQFAALISIPQIPAIPAPTASRPFVFVSLPDTQVYSENRFPGDGRLPAVTDSRGTAAIFLDQTAWIAENRDALGIRYVGHLGDIVLNGNNLDEWERSKAAMNVLLDANIPHGTVMGNHDDNHEGNYQQNYLENFGPQVFAGRSWYSGSSPGGGANLQLLQHEGVKIGFLNFSIDQPQSEVDWANQIVEDHSDTIFIVGTHRYLYDFKLAGGRYGETVATPFGPMTIQDRFVDGVVDPNTGEQLFNEFVNQHPNILMIHAGHFHSEWLRLDGKNSAEQTVIQILTDYQSARNGGDGWLRVYEMDFEHGTFRFDTYSPTLDRFRTTIDHFVESIHLAAVESDAVMAALGISEQQYQVLLRVLKDVPAVPDGFLTMHPDFDEPAEQAYYNQYLSDLFLGDIPAGFGDILEWEGLWLQAFAADPTNPLDFSDWVRSPSGAMPIDYSAYLASAAATTTGRGLELLKIVDLDRLGRGASEILSETRQQGEAPTDDDPPRDSPFEIPWVVLPGHLSVVDRLMTDFAEAATVDSDNEPGKSLLEEVVDELSERERQQQGVKLPNDSLPQLAAGRREVEEVDIEANSRTKRCTISPQPDPRRP
jgi:hypothetical protein